MRPLAPGSLASRLAAIALAVAVALLAKAAVLDPALQAQRQTTEALGQAAAQLARLQAVAATKPRLEALAARLERDMGRSDAFLRADTEALAGAALQERLRSLAGSEGIALGAMQWGAEKAENGLGRVSVRVQISTSIGPLYALLAAIETGTPPLFIDDIDIQGPPGPQPDHAYQPVPLSVSFDCFGYWLPPAGGAAKAAP